MPKIQEIARQLITAMRCNPQDMSVEDREFFQDSCFMKQIEAEISNDSFITDRTVLDILAYSQDLPKAFYDRMKGKIGRWLELDPYDIIFYTPIEFDMEVDGVRVDDEEYRKTIDERILKLFQYFKVPYVTLTGTVEDRIETIKQEIDRNTVK